MDVFLTFSRAAYVKAGRSWYTKAVGDLAGVDVVGMYDLEKRESESACRATSGSPRPSSGASSTRTRRRRLRRRRRGGRCDSSVASR